jgi:ATP/maltotriose-dependent transcriptional regulator MalT/DNA-binding SARP family transcriptional activator
MKTVTIRRPRLERLLSSAAESRLTTMIAGSGLGKSTLLAQWSESHDALVHAVTADDRALATMARSILDQVRLAVPAVSGDLVLAIDGPRGPDADPDSTVRADALARMLCAEIDARLNRQLTLVLDDFHIAGDDPAVARFIGGVCRNAPAQLHLVIASRRPVVFPISRLRLDGHVAEIAPDALSFTRDEVEQILQASFGDEALALADELHRQTSGWPAAVRLAVQALSVSSDPSRLELAPADRGPMYEYLAEEVVEAEQDEVVGLLRVAAALPWVSDGLVGHLGIEPGTLAEARRRGVYLSDTAAEPGAATLAPLMRDFMEAHEPLGEAARSELCRTAADWYESNGYHGDAIESLFSGGDTAAVVSLIGRRGRDLLSAGLASRVVAAIERLGDLVDASDLALVEAEARQILGDWEGALQRYAAIAPPVGEIPAAVAWRMGLLHHMRGDVAAALETYGRGVIDGTDVSNEAALLGWTAGAEWLRGERDAALANADRALELARRADDAAALATAHTVIAMVAALDGDRSANDAHYLRALEHAERAQDVLQTIRIRSNRGSLKLEEGAYEDALAELDIALQLAETTGFATFRALALSNQAQALFHLGRIEEAVAGLEEARSLFRRTGSRLEAYPLAHLGDVYRARGDTALARAAYEQAIALCEEADDLQGLVPSLAGLARVLAEDDRSTAAALARRATENGSVLGHVGALLAAGWIVAESDPDRALSLAGEAADLARSRRDRPGLAEALELEAAAAAPERAEQLLLQARSLWGELHNPLGMARTDLALARLVSGAEGLSLARDAVERLRNLGALGAATMGEALLAEMEEESRPALRIRTLGGFSVEHDGSAVGTSVWQSRKARDLLKMLIAARGRPQHREVLIEALWPDDDPAKSGNRLSVAISTIRTVLDPTKTYPSDKYVVSDKESVALDTGSVVIDVEEFLGGAAAGLDLYRTGRVDAGLVEMRRAEALYVGDFLEEQPYDDWAVALREECRNVYLQITSRLAKAAEGGGEHDTAARLYLRMLERDPYHEPAHLGLVAAMVAAGRHGAARRLYGVYADRMASLGVEPAAFPGPGVVRP